MYTIQIYITIRIHIDIDIDSSIDTYIQIRERRWFSDRIDTGLIAGATSASACLQASTQLRIQVCSYAYIHLYTNIYMCIYLLLICVCTRLYLNR